MQKNFDVLTVELEGSNLIEASAGTGKTYSIAILALRMIVEKEIPIEKILMVTFTKAAVAELESRIREFVRLAYKFASGKEIDDDTIKEAIGIPNETKIKLLSKAVQSMDNLSVMTIHSFCQKTIDEFTFETNQSFNYEIVQDDSFLLQELALAFRRERVNTIDDYSWFKKTNASLKFDKLTEILKKYLEEKTFLDVDLSKKLDIKKVIDESNKAYVALSEQIDNDFVKIQTTKIHGGSRLAKNRQNPTQFLPVFIQECLSSEKKYIPKFDFLYEPYGKNYADSLAKVEDSFYTNFIVSAKEAVVIRKKKKGYISYNDQIRNIHRALQNNMFKQNLEKKYDAVFIDEFQDTDKYQYEIFSSVFSETSIVFYIGDPKQSIYGWRSADLDTYKLAKNNVGESIFSMNKNYRSTNKVINALNSLLNSDEEFNMFLDDEIVYHNVINGAVDLGIMSDQNKEVSPITLWEFDENDDETNYKAVAQEVFRLLTEDVKINNSKITPKDIGILVRGKKEGDEIKKALAVLNIPAVNRDGAKVLKSGESDMIKYLLKAVLSPNRGDINRALYSSFFGFTSDYLKIIDEEKHIDIFIGLRKTINTEGIYNMISSFLDIYGVRTHCMKDILGQRVLTNIGQIAEILHKIEKQLRYTPEELLIWMERSSDDANEEFEQRVESDDEAVQISTIHKAKGLEFNIVFAPCLSMIPKKRFLSVGNVVEFKKDGEYLFTLNYPALSKEDKNISESQKEQENRRLIYVALTRAVYKCYISLVPKRYRKNMVPSSLSMVTEHYNNDSKLIEKIKLDKAALPFIKGHYKMDNNENEFTAREKPDIEIKNTFGIHSYSGLSKTHQTVPFEKIELGDKDNYDQFIFQDLARGADAGVALHSIFELLDFNNQSSWNGTLQKTSKYYSNIIKKESLHLFEQLVHHVMHAEIICKNEKFILSNLTNEQKIPELEFYFSMDNVNKNELNKILGEEADLEGENDIEGLMHGFIDLFFEYNGRYYILDWKSNFLGNNLVDYNTKGLSDSMKGNNYTLQSYIYTIAVSRFLNERLPKFDYDRDFGGVIYMFLRGVRSDGATGIYYNKPPLDKIISIENMLNKKK